MSPKRIIKVIKRSEREHRAMPEQSVGQQSAPTKHVRSQEIGRDVKATIVGWVDEFRQKRQAETARGVNSLFSEVVRSPDPQSV